MRHAHPELCFTFTSRFEDPTEVVLDETYRCPRSNLEAARALMTGQPGVEGVPKTSHRDTEGRFELVNYATEGAEASGIAQAATKIQNSDAKVRILILAPNRKVASVIETELQRISAKYVTTFRLPESDDSIARIGVAIARLLGNPRDSLAAASLILLCGPRSKSETLCHELVNTSTGDGYNAAGFLISTGSLTLSPALSRSVRKAAELLDKYKSMNLEDAINELENEYGAIGLDKFVLPTGSKARLESVVDDGDTLEEEVVPEPEPDAPSIKLTTYHSSKGLEAEYVFAAAVEPDFFEDDDRSSANEKRRQLFVGITRSRILTAVSFTSRRYGASRFVGQASASRRGASDFVSEIRQALKIAPTTGEQFLKSLD